MLRLHRRPVPSGLPVLSSEFQSSPDALLMGAVKLAREALNALGPEIRSRKHAVDTESAAWAVLGEIEHGQAELHAKLLERLFESQRSDGQLPVSLSDSPLQRFRFNLWLRRSARPAALQPDYEGEAQMCRRQQALLIWACAEMAVCTGNTEACRRWRAPLEAAMAWLDRQPPAPSPDVRLEALAHQARMALGHLSILLGDAVTGARHWAAAATSKARIQAAALASLPAADHLWATIVGAHGAPDPSPSSEEVSPQSGLMAWAAAQAGDLDRARRTLLDAAREALSQGQFENSVSAGQFLRGVASWRRLSNARASVSAPVRRRQWELSEDEARILSLC